MNEKYKNAVSTHSVGDRVTFRKIVSAFGDKETQQGVITKVVFTDTPVVGIDYLCYYNIDHNDDMNIYDFEIKFNETHTERVLDEMLGI